MGKLDTVTIPDLSGKVILVTGGTGGIGKGIVAALASHNAEQIFFSGRNVKLAESAISEIHKTSPKAKISFLPCDLSSLESVTSAAKSFLDKSSRLDILICGAGIMATPKGTTKDGYEIQMGTNHLGHALLIKHLLPALLRTASTQGDARVVSITSLGMGLAPTGGIIFKDLRGPQDLGFGGRWTRYGQSKLANVLYASELGRQYPSLSTAAVHPGVIMTELVNGLGFADRSLIYLTTRRQEVTAEEGTRNPLWAATVGRDRLIGDERADFYEPVGKIGTASKYSGDAKLAGKLWDWTQEQMKGHEI